MKDTPRKKSTGSVSDKRFAQGVKITDLIELEVASLPKNKGMTERSITSNKMTRSSIEKSSDSIHSQQRK